MTSPHPGANAPMTARGSAVRAFFQRPQSGGVVLMASAAAALAVANSPWSAGYFAALATDLAGLGLLHWINDGLMALFFLRVGLEIKREGLAGQLARAEQRVLPCLAALGGVVVPALVFVFFNHGDAARLRGWAIPTATDIAFALGVLSLLGPRVAPSLTLFLAALAILDDLVAVLVIALFYTARIDGVFLALAGAMLAVLVACNRTGVRRLAVYLPLGALLWWLVLRSGVHATLAGVALAWCVPLHPRGDRADAGAHTDVDADADLDIGGEPSPLHRLEHAIAPWIAFVVIPVFGFANAGMSFAGVTWAALLQPVTLGVALGLLLGKPVGVMAALVLARASGIARLPAGATWWQMAGIAVLCGIGFTMSLFIGLLAYRDVSQQDAIKLGVLAGSAVSGLLGWAVLRCAAGTAIPKRN